jgi:hypothetical protein
MKEIKTEAAALAAVRQDGMALRQVPLAMRSEEVCMAAVGQDGRALRCAVLARRRSP